MMHFHLCQLGAVSDTCNQLNLTNPQPALPLYSPNKQHHYPPRCLSQKVSLDPSPSPMTSNQFPGLTTSPSKKDLEPPILSIPTTPLSRHHHLSHYIYQYCSLQIFWYPVIRGFLLRLKGFSLPQNYVQRPWHHIQGPLSSGLNLFLSSLISHHCPCPPCAAATVPY